MFGAKELTDTMILEGIHIKNSLFKIAPVVLGIIILIFIVCIIRLVSMKKKEQDENKLKTLKNNIIGLSIASCVFAGLIGGSFYLIKFQEAHEDEWSIETGTISNLRKRIKSSAERRSVTYYAYVDGYNEKISISEDEYNSFAEGDEVYVILNFRGHANDVWSMEEYIYVGDRMKN
jgi:hypothetical protein